MDATPSAPLPQDSRRLAVNDAGAGGDATIRQALAIRKVVLPLLANGTVTQAGVMTLGRASEPAWRLFLRAECCAAPVAVALRRHGVFDQLPSLPC